MSEPKFMQVEILNADGTVFTTFQEMIPETLAYLDEPEGYQKMSPEEQAKTVIRLFNDTLKPGEQSRRYSGLVNING